MNDFLSPTPFQTHMNSCLQDLLVNIVFDRDSFGKEKKKLLLKIKFQ